jgi:prepilin-type N-terminal cleavage/methylation domain-containing protein
MRLVRSQKGQTLIEVLIAVALLGMLATAFLGGLFAALKADIIADERAVCQSLSQSHLEFVKSQAWSTKPTEVGVNFTYTVTSSGISGSPAGQEPSWFNSVPLIPERYHGYSLQVEINNIKGESDEKITLRQITVEVYRIGEPKLTLEGYKAKI